MTNTSSAFTKHLANGMQDAYQASQSTSAPRTGAAATPAQIKAYNEMCTRKNITPLDTSAMSKSEISTHIEAIVALPFPPSPVQREKIDALIAELTAAGVRINISQEKLASLTGGANGTASLLINFLYDQKRANGVVDGISDKQVEILTEWFLCPDIPFEDYNVSKRFYLEKLNAVSSDENVEERMESRKWRLVTAEEFAERIRANVNREQASKLIDQHRATFYEWKKTRVSSKQIAFIQQLETRLASLYVPKEAAFAVDPEGNIIEMAKKPARDYNPTAHQPMDILMLAQLSYDDASKYIDQLRVDLEERPRGTVDNESYQQDLQDKHATYNDLRDTGGVAHDTEQARVLEYAKLNDILFALDAIRGYDNTPLHDALSHTVLDGQGNAAVFAAEFKDYMRSTITAEKFERDIARLRVMTEPSLVATDMLNELLSDMLS